MKRHCMLGSVALLVILTGCSTDSGTLVAPILSAPTANRSAAMSAATVGPEGGTITADGATLSIPAGALTGAVEVTLVTGVLNGLDYCEVLPVDLLFLEKATITMRKPAAALENQFALRVLDAAGQWSYLVTSDLGSTLSGKFQQGLRIEITDPND